MAKDPYAEGMVKDGTPADYLDEENGDKKKKMIPLPRPRPDFVNRAKKADKLIIIKKADGGMIDGAAIRGKTKGTMC